MQMLVYHGSNSVHDNPRILVSDRYGDYGPGFSTTTSKALATSFAERLTKLRHTGRSCVSVYELDAEKAKTMRVLVFQAPDGPWLDFVSANRAGTMKQGEYDIIRGPQVDDDGYTALVLYQAGVLTRTQTIAMLRGKQFSDQYVFGTEESLQCLTFKGYVQ